MRGKMGGGKDVGLIQVCRYNHEELRKVNHHCPQSFLSEFYQFYCILWRHRPQLVHLYYDPLPRRINHWVVGSCVGKHHCLVRNCLNQMGIQRHLGQGRWYQYINMKSWLCQSMRKDWLKIISIIFKVIIRVRAYMNIIIKCFRLYSSHSSKEDGTGSRRAEERYWGWMGTEGDVNVIVMWLKTEEVMEVWENTCGD